MGLPSVDVLPEPRPRPTDGRDDPAMTVFIVVAALAFSARVAADLGYLASTSSRASRLGPSIITARVSPST
jgi:hypothetical protein